ncbi:hypothetical protein CBS101457_005748 [Exobasidium rhododendri]|nr:hypothetical protein CBS101457_005748 [Exobasidium rhododendri]
MSRILVTDSSPIRPPAGDEDKRVPRAPHDLPSSNRMANAMNGSGQFSRTEFRKSGSPTLDKGSNGASSSSSSLVPPAAASSSSSGSRLISMAAKMNARSENALPPKTTTTTNGTTRRERSLSSDNDSSHSSQKKFKTSMEKFTYQGAKPTRRMSPVVIDDDDDDSSSLSSIGSKEVVKEVPKKRKFIRGGKRAISNLDSEDDDDVQLTSAPTSLSASSSQTNGKAVEESDLKYATKRIASLHPSWEIDRIQKSLIDCKTDYVAAMQALKVHYAASPSTSAANTPPPVPNTTARHAALLPPITKTQGTASYLKSPASNRQGNHSFGKGIQVSSRAASSSPVFVSQQVKPPLAKLPPPPPPNKAVNRVKSAHTNSAATSSISVSDGDSDDQSSDGSDDGGFDREKKEEKKALQWFNQVDEKQLMDIIGVNKEQATTIMELRPFTSSNDVTSKLGNKSAKGVTPKLFHNCVDLMSGLQQIDSVLEKCESMGSKLNSVLDEWNKSATVGGDDKEYLHGQPDGLSAGVQLKDFQLHGVNWLYLLYRKHCSGILADDMGLGKTAQVIAFLNIVTKKNDQRPHLIVVPSSVLTNWMREFKVFGPGLNVYKYHGSQSERMVQQRELRHNRDDVDVIITTYDMASGGERDHTFLRKYEFEACIFDEGHILKNQKSIKYTKLVKIRAKWRLLLTGTPLQNNLGELISLLKFIMPSYFRGAEEALGQIFKVNQQSQLSKERVNRAKKMMQPFLLRRKKVDVLLDLKPKTEIVKYCEMTPDQSKIYKDAFAKSKAALLQLQQESAQQAASTTTRGKKGPVNKNKSGHVLMELRKAANHPLLFRRLFTDAKLEALARDYLKNEEYADEDLTMKKEDFAINSDAELSMSVAAQYKTCNKHMLSSKEWLNAGKISALKEVIDEAASQGERLIIFSQFVQTLEIICRALEVMGVTYRGFTGSTDVDSRQEIVDEFTKDTSIRCFLLSTRAGGVGINLTAANWVVLFDQDFNPQNDRQAADRAYRMGQEKKVTIIRLISKNTIDEHILELGKSKLKLAERVEGATDEEDAEESLAANQEEVEQKVEQTLLARLAQDDTE